MKHLTHDRPNHRLTAGACFLFLLLALEVGVLVPASVEARDQASNHQSRVLAAEAAHTRIQALLDCWERGDLSVATGPNGKLALVSRAATLPTQALTTSTEPVSVTALETVSTHWLRVVAVAQTEEATRAAMCLFRLEADGTIQPMTNAKGPPRIYYLNPGDL